MDAHCPYARIAWLMSDNNTGHSAHTMASSFEGLYVTAESPAGEAEGKVNSSESRDSWGGSGVNWPGLAAVICFYLLMLAVGIYASCRKRRWQNNDSEDLMLAGRNIGWVTGIFTMTATWVGGGYILGTAEVVFTPGAGLIWSQATFAYSIALSIAGFAFARKMRDAGYVTMLDPFAQRYGDVMCGLLYIPALLGDVFFAGAILSALGASLAVILGINIQMAIILSAGIATLYTVFGGLYSVIFTDVIQLTCIGLGMYMCLGFALTHEAVGNIIETAASNDSWLGHIDNGPVIGYWIDSALLLLLGGIPWQIYFQRVLSSDSSSHAVTWSYIATFGCLLMATPSILIGAIGKSTDWSKTEYPGPIPIQKSEYNLILPLVLQYLTPLPVAVIGLGAVSAAVMSSADSTILSSSTMFAKNVYTPFRNALSSKSKASEREIIWVMRLSIIVVGALSTTMAVVVSSIYGLWYLCSDLIYVILFPNLLIVIYMDNSNTYGSLSGYIIALVFRLIGGEPLLGLPALLKYPYYDDVTGYQNFPFKTLAMLLCLITTAGMSVIVEKLFKGGYLSKSYDVFKCFEDKSYTLAKAHTNDVDTYENGVIGDIEVEVKDVSL